MQTSIHLISRRRFLAASTAALGLAPMAWLRAQEGSPNDEITIGIIGCGAMGSANMTNFSSLPGARVVAVCDVDVQRMTKAKDSVDGHYHNQDCKTYRHYGDLFQHPGLDAVCICTPDHLHAIIGIAAAQAGLDIYGEKPFAWGLAEGRMLVDAVTKNQRVWQTGSWQRSAGEFRRFRALIQNNTLGKLTRFQCGTPSGYRIANKVPEDQWPALIGKAPAHLDWDAWCGPVQNFPYHPLLHPWDWRWHHTFGGGQLLDWVGHHVDIAMWTLGLHHTGPVKVEGTGEPTTHPFFNAYPEYQYRGTFADGTVIEVDSTGFGAKFTGENGWIHVNRGKLEASDRDLLRNLPADFDTKPPSHWQNFLDCVRSRKPARSDAASAHRVASFGQLALVAMETGAPVHWDPATEKVLNNDVQASHPRLGSRVPA